MIDTVELLGTAIGVGGVMVTAGVFVVRSVIAADVKPLNDTMIALTGAVGGLKSTIEQEREIRREERHETTKILSDLKTLVHDHEVTLAQHAIRLDKLEGPPPNTTRKRPAA